MVNIESPFAFKEYENVPIVNDKHYLPDRLYCCTWEFWKNYQGLKGYVMINDSCQIRAIEFESRDIRPIYIDGMAEIKFIDKK